MAAALGGHGLEEQVEDRPRTARPAGGARPACCIGLAAARRARGSAGPAPPGRARAWCGCPTAPWRRRSACPPGARLLVGRPSSEKVRMCSPRVMTSPSRRRWSLATWSPLSRVPFLLPRSTHEEAAAVAADLRVVAGEPLVGQEDVALARAADGDAVLGEREALLARPSAALDRDLGHRRRARRRFTAARRFTAKYPLRTRTSASLRLDAGAPRSSRQVPSGGLLRRVGQQVVVVQLVGDAGEDLDQLADLVREEERPARLLRDLAQEAARAAAEQARLAADEHAVDGGLHRARVVDHLLLRHAARGVRAVGEDDDGLAPRLVPDAVQAVVDGVVQAGAAPGLQRLDELLEAVHVAGELRAALHALVELHDQRRSPRPPAC